MPARCVLDVSDSFDHALCMTSSTLDDEAELHDGFDSDGDNSMSLVDNFTIAFWARAREALNFTQTASETGVTFIPRACLFFPLIAQTNSSFQRRLGFHLGTDGFSLVWHGVSTLAPIVAYRQSLR